MFEKTNLLLHSKIKSINKMEKMYSRNRIYIKPDEQEKIKHFRVLLGGAGIGSIIAECALRMGFETITISMVIRWRKAT